MNLAEKIENRKAIIGIIGLGYVGLPLAVEFASSGFKVIGFDVNKEKTGKVGKGVSYIQDVPSERLSSLVSKGMIEATADFSALSRISAVSICVPTPLRKSKDPDISYIVSAAKEVKKYLHKEELVILESTTYPGTTEEILLPELAETGLRVGEDFYLAFSPERVDPGNDKFNTRNTPKILGGITPKCAAMAKLLYEKAIDKVVTVSSASAAEMVKLLENTFRAVNIGLVNEITIMCDKLGIDVWEIIDAAATKPFGFMPFYPGPGLGGHCIPIDPHYLSWKLKLLNYNARFIELAGEINSYMPSYVVGKIAKALNRAGKPVNGSSILVLGVSYKKNVSDVRESPALDIIRLLELDGAKVSYHDPNVPIINHDAFSLTNKELTASLIESQDCVVIVTDHGGIDWDMVLNCSKLVVDTRNVLKRKGPNVVSL